MRIIISNRSPIPIYEQIKDQVIKQILNDELEENQKLPSIRQLAKDLKVSVITTTRAYKELEDEGYIVSAQGKGFFILPKNEQLSQELKTAKMEQLLSEALKLKKEIHMSDVDFNHIINILEEDINHE